MNKTLNHRTARRRSGGSEKKDRTRRRPSWADITQLLAGIFALAAALVGFATLVASDISDVEPSGGENVEAAEEGRAQ